MSRYTLNALAAVRLASLARGVFAASMLLSLPLAAVTLAPSSAFAHARQASQTERPAAQAGSPPRPIGTTASGAGVDITLHLQHLGFISSPLPSYEATDAQGNLYISDVSDNAVIMYDSNYNLVRQFGSGTTGTGNGDLHGPGGIVVTGSNVYVVDEGNHMIQVFNQSSGSWISQFGATHLTFPTGMTLGTNGTLYVADGSGNDIAEFSTGGAYLGSFGSGGSGNGQFNDPGDIAASPTGLLYVSDEINHRVEAFDLSGTYDTQWGSSSFLRPAGMAVDRAGIVYVVDTLARTVYLFDPSGSLVGSYGTPQTTPFVYGTFDAPQDVAVSVVPNKPITVYVSDGGTGSGGFVQRFDLANNPQKHPYESQWGSLGSGNGQFNHSLDTVVDAAGNVFVSDFNNNRVEKFDQFGNFLLSFGGQGSGDGQLKQPAGLAFSPDGTTLYVADLGNNRIEEYDPSGSYLGQFGGFGSGNGQLKGPQGVTTDGTLVYVADTQNNRIEVFDTSGAYDYQFGSFGNGDTQFDAPVDVALDVNRSELFISDFYNSRVQVFGLTGVFVASLPAANSIAFSGPEGITTDQRGDVYVADTDNGRIVEFDVNLTRTTTFGTTGTGNGQLSHPWGVAASPASGQLYVADQFNNRVERFGSPWPKDDTIGIYRPSAKTFYLRNENLTGPADITVYMPYALTGDLPIVGDWNGDGVDTVGLYRPSKARFLLQDANVQESAPDYTFTLGIAGDTPIAGDWNGDGTDGAGIFRPSNGILYLKNSLSTGVADDTLVLGVPGDVGIAGDWNGDGQDSPGVYRPSTQRFFVTNKVTNGVVTSDHSAVLGISGDVPFTGDWVAQGFSGIGVFRPSNGITYEKNVISTGPADNQFVYGIAGDVPVAGQWVAPSVVFTTPAPHVSLGTRSGAAPHAASGPSAPTHPASTSHAPAALPRR